MKTISLVVFALLTNVILGNAQTTFAEPYLISGKVVAPKTVEFADMDGDGDNDIIYGEWSGNNIAWIENMDGLGNFGNYHLITNYTPVTYCIAVKDIDNDGDMDVINASHFTEPVMWHENVHGFGKIWQSHLISSNMHGMEYVCLDDLDSDGDLDALFSCVGYGTYWCENLDGNGNFDSIPNVIDSTYSKCSRPVDIDGDGDMDIVIATAEDKTVSWYENIDGQCNFGSRQLVADSVNWATYILPIDIDNDGDSDIITAIEYEQKVILNKNLDGSGTFGERILISSELFPFNFVSASDIDNDGDQDIFAAAEDSNIIAWYENLNGEGQFGAANIISDNRLYPSWNVCGDVDNDGDLDLITASLSDHTISWYENSNGAGNLNIEHKIASSPYDPKSLCLGDINGDGYMDILVSSFLADEVVFFENVNGNKFSLPKVISNDIYRPFKIETGDLDKDGDVDVVVGSQGNNNLHWIENIGGAGTVFSKHLISNSALSTVSIHLEDIDNDQDLDIISATNHVDSTGLQERVIGLYENINGDGIFSELKGVDKFTNYPILVNSSDIDGDGDSDILSASQISNNIHVLAWYENINGYSFKIPPNLLVITPYIQFVHPCDLDGDNDNDVLFGPYYVGSEIPWVENTDGNGNFALQTISTNETGNSYSLKPCDIDNDGDIDIIQSSLNRVNWYDRNDSTNSFSNLRVVADNIRTSFIEICDIDNDGDKDIIAIGRHDHKIWIIKNLTIINIPTVAKNQVSVFPNPSSNKLYLELETQNIQQLRIFDITGKSVLDQKNIPTPESIYISGLKSGVYILHIETDKEVYTSKFVKE